MLIEIHMLQNHAPSNLNRDETGSPKDCIFGGVRRARISSQCLKRTIRRSPIFREALQAVGLGIRTRRLPERVKEVLLERGLDNGLAEVAAAKASGFGTKDGKEQKEPRTAQMMFLTEADISAVADVLEEAAREAGSVEEFKRIPAKDLQAKATLKGWRPITPDIALFGRMITSEAFRDVEAAVQVAHAISTNKMEHEFDYYTAVDDLLGMTEEDESGAGMIGDVEFNSACFYKYFSLDVDALVGNLAGPAPGERATRREKELYRQSLTEAWRVAELTVPAFVRAATFVTPSGKQNTFAAHQLPDAILIEVRPYKIAVSYANAFVDPVRVSGLGDLTESSIRRLANHVVTLTDKYSLQASPRLWFCTRNVPIPGTTPCCRFDDLLEALGPVLKPGEMSDE